MNDNISVQNVAGYKVIYCYHPGPLVACRCIFNAGSCNETDPKDYGAAHYLEHMFFKGTEHKDWRQIDKELDALGDYNAYTNYDKTGYYINSLTEDFGKAFGLLTEMIFESRFDPVEFAKENTVIQEEIQSYEDDPNGFFGSRVMESVWGPMGHWIAGKKDVVAAMTVDNLLRFKKNNYDKSNMVFVIVGGLEPKQQGEIITILAKYLDAMPEGTLRTWQSAKPQLENLELEHTSTQAILTMTMQGLSSKESMERNYVDDLFLNSLGQAAHSVLFSRIRQELGLCYAISAYCDGYGGNNSINIWTMIDAKNIDLVHDEILKEYRKVQQAGFEDEVLEISKKSMLYRICRNLTTPVGISGTLFEKYFIEGIFDPDKYKKGVLGLTNKDMMAFAEEMISGGVKLSVMNRSK